MHTIKKNNTRLIKLFYINLNFEELTLTTLVRGDEVCVHMDDFGNMFELHCFGETTPMIDLLDQRI